MGVEVSQEEGSQEALCEVEKEAESDQCANERTIDELVISHIRRCFWFRYHNQEEEEESAFEGDIEWTLVEEDGVRDCKGCESGEADSELPVTIDDVSGADQGEECGEAEFFTKKRESRSGIGAPPGRQQAEKADDHRP